MPRRAEIELTDNDGYIVRIYPEYDEEGNKTTKERVEVFTDTKKIATFIQKELKTPKD